MKLIHITDIHLTADKKCIAGLQPHDNFQRCVSHINTHHADADIAVITGDLAHKGEPEAYVQLQQFIQQLTMPVELVIGNHDNREHFFAHFPAAYQDRNGFAQGFRDTSVGRFVYLDTVCGTLSTPGKSHAGFYDEQRQQWLEQQLRQARLDHVPVYLFMHHHPRDVLVTPCDILGLQQKNDFNHLLRQYHSTIKYLFFGHCHLTLSGVVSGIPFSSLKGTNHQVLADFTNKKHFKISAQTPAYNVVFFDQGDVVIHSIDYSYDEDYREVGTSWDEWDKYA